LTYYNYYPYSVLRISQYFLYLQPFLKRMAGGSSAR
jgi:hypothetical protein